MSNGNSLAGVIRKEMAREANVRFLRSLPVFRVDQQIPPRFIELLRHLDRVEPGHGGLKQER